MNTQEFFATHPVFTLTEANDGLAPPGGRSAMKERLDYHVRKGRLQRITRGVFAAVPADVGTGGFTPDPYLVAAAVRPEGILSHHAALELLGVAHSMWNECTLYTKRPRKSLDMGSRTLRFFKYPVRLRNRGLVDVGCRKVERRGKLLRVTGPERTLVDGFRRPELVGGLEELVVSAGGFATLDLELLSRVLTGYETRYLWAAVGWFLERHQREFHVPGEYLLTLAAQAPTVPRYLVRDSRGGTLNKRWSLILPAQLADRDDRNEP